MKFSRDQSGLQSFSIPLILAQDKSGVLRNGTHKMSFTVDKAERSKAGSDDGASLTTHTILVLPKLTVWVRLLS